MDDSTHYYIPIVIVIYPGADPEEGTGGRVLKNHKNIGFLSNTGPDPLKNHKATKPAFKTLPKLDPL